MLHNLFHEVSNMVLDINILQGIVIKLNIPIYNNKDILPGPSEYWTSKWNNPGSENLSFVSNFVIFSQQSTYYLKQLYK